MLLDAQIGLMLQRLWSSHDRRKYKLEDLWVLGAPPCTISRPYILESEYSSPLIRRPHIEFGPKKRNSKGSANAVNLCGNT